MRDGLKVLLLIFFTVTVIPIYCDKAWAVPDADVTDIYNPSSLVALQTFVVRVELFNYGSAGTIPLSMYIDDAYQATFYIPVNEWSYSWVDVTVSGGLSAGYHTIAFCASNCRTEGWAWTGMPDLQLTDVYPPSSTVGGQNSTITSRVDNIGNANAGAFYLDMYIDGEYVTSWNYSSGLSARSYVESSVTLTGGLVAGAHNIQFIVDATSTVAESNENNNTRTETFTWTGTPDLKLTDIYPPSSTVGGQNSTITSRVDNIGYKNSGAFYLDMYINGEYVTSWNYSSGLSARSYVESSVTLTGGLVAGAHNIQFIVDATSTVAESNENNNTRTETFTWTGTPDLQLTDIYNPTSLISGTNTTMATKITNIGYANADSFWVDMYLDDEYVISWDFTSGLSAKAYGEASVTLTGGLVDGTHSIKFIADVLNEVVESNEINNNRTESFTWTGGVPDLELTDIYNPTSLVSGAITTITAKVTNWGYGSANPFYLDLYIDGVLFAYWDFSFDLHALKYAEASITINGGLTPGTHSIEFIADSMNDVIESNEGNNNRIESFTWVDPVPSTCSSTAGSGNGVLGDTKYHIDTCRDSGSGIYYLYDSSRRLNNNPHAHNGIMSAGRGIESSKYSIGVMSDPDNIWDASDQSSGVDAHVYAAMVYDYWLFQQPPLKNWIVNSFDNAGSSMDSQVDLTMLSNNANWNGYWVNYFVSSGTNNKSTAASLDVVAHEWGHALTENTSFLRGKGSTLDYQGWSGALNEAFSDWMGVATEKFYRPNAWNWTIGEDSIKPTPWRNLLNPAAGLRPQPEKVGGTNWYPLTGCVAVCDDKDPAYNDCCGVHTNSGVPNKMFYLLSAGGTDPVSTINVQAITVEKAIEIALFANQHYWPHDADFYTARTGMISAATAIFGSATANEVNQVRNAWAAVGVGTIPKVDTTTSPSGGGTTAGGGSKEWGATMTVTATPDQGYAFQNWTEDGVEVSTSASYTFTADGDRTLIANFAPAPEISVNPASWNFGSYYVGNPSPYNTFTVTNTGLQSLTIQSISISGTDALEFSYIDICTSHTLFPNGNCTIDIKFLPMSTSSKIAILSIQSNDPNTPVLNVSLRGTGLNNLPVANPGGTYIAIEGQTISLNGSGSTDSDGSIVLYEWDVNDDGVYEYSSSSPTQNHTYSQQGLYTIRLRVTDNLGSTGEATTTASISHSSSTPVTINGRQLSVNGSPFTVKGVVYSPTPIGDDPATTPPYGDYFTSDRSSIYTRDLPKIRQMGANTIRLLNWNNTANHFDFLDKAYNNGNNPLYVIAGFWINPGLDIDPASPGNVRDQLKADFRAMVSTHKNFPAILMWSIGSNLNAEWMYGSKLADLFSLLNEMASEAHTEEGASYHPVTIALSDNNLINTVSSYNASVPSLDVWGANIHRGNTFGSLFGDYQTVSTKPLIILEYGIDAYDNIHGIEYENAGPPLQAEYGRSLWNEIRTNSSVCIGGTIMSYSDEWWRGTLFAPNCSDNDPLYHGACGYAYTYEPDGYVNDEWWGIMRITNNGFSPDIMTPREIYYTLYLDPDTDSDSDGIPDSFELRYGLNPELDDANNDPDDDELTNIQEYTKETKPRTADSDGDGVSDGLDIYPTVASKIWTDDTITSNITVIKAVHITELRTAVNQLRLRRGLSPYSWTNLSLTQGSSFIKAEDITDLRRALNDVLTPAPVWEIDPNVVRGTMVMGSHIRDLRYAVQNAW